jgi:hypothetical protein
MEKWILYCLVIIFSVFSLFDCTTVGGIKAIRINYEDNQYLDKKTGTLIRWVNDDNMFPKSWQTKEIDPKASPLMEENLIFSFYITLYELQKYPKELLKDTIKEIYLVHSLFLYGSSSGGVYGSKKIFLSNRGKDFGFTEKFLIETFHRNVAGLLMTNFPYQLNTIKWNECNPSEFAYRNGKNDSMEYEGPELMGDNYYFSQGFLNEYATTGLIMDFQEYSAKLFSGDQDIWLLYESFDRIKRKTDIVLAFYLDLDNSLTREYFKSLKPGTLKNIGLL